MLNILEISHVKKIAELDWFIGISFMNHPIMFLDRDIKWSKLVPASFSYFLKLLWEKTKF